MVTVVGVVEQAISRVQVVPEFIWMMKAWIKVSVSEKERESFEVGKGRSGDLNDVELRRKVKHD